MMKRSKFAKALSALLSLVLAVSFAFPVAALANEKEIQVDNHSSAQQATVVSDITIDGVAAPQAGELLDDTAQVTTAEGETWDIPVLWLSSDLQLATQAEPDVSYLPALAFFFPQGIAAEGDGITVTLSESLAELFGGNEIISIYDASTGITFILPASLKGFFAPSGTAHTVPNQPEETSSEALPVATSPEPSLIDIYCAQTARDALSDEDLEYLIDLIINRLQPQAVNLLINSFPAFRAAADNGGIGTEISLYIYYKNGDKDGLSEHEGASSALAYVAKDVLKRDGEYVFCYMLAVDIDTLLAGSEDAHTVNPETGKYILLREGEGMVTFENTIVHETLHAIMSDYNRPGMVGGVRESDVYTGDSSTFSSPALAQKYSKTRYPLWFIEGTASAVENVYAFRYNSFQRLRGELGGGSGLADAFDVDHLVYNYLNGTAGGSFMYFDIGFSTGRDATGALIDDTSSRYVTGYLATLYLAELAARKAGGSAVTVTDSSLSVSSEALRMGLNSIFERMNKGETLDQVIYDISPLDANGEKRYADTDTFQNLFIKGPALEGNRYEGDFGKGGSAEFVTQFLNYMLLVEQDNGARPNGSILMDFTTTEVTPLDKAKVESSDFLKIIESNQYHESTVPGSVAFAGGGKSLSGTPTSTSSGKVLQAASTAAKPTTSAIAVLPAAAKSAAAEPQVTGAAESAAAGEPAASVVGPVADAPVANGTEPAAADTPAVSAKKPSDADATEPPVAGSAVSAASRASASAKATAVDSSDEDAADGAEATDASVFAGESSDDANR